MASQYKSMHTLFSPDTDSGLSMPSGTLRASNSWRNLDSSSGATSRMTEEDHEKLIKSLLHRSVDSSMLAGATSSSPLMNSTTPAAEHMERESYLLPPRSSSPVRSPSRTDRMNVSMQSSLNASVDRLNAIAPENYFTSGLAKSLSASLHNNESRKNVLLDKLKDAQETLRSQSTRLSKMESDYHTASYEVEELKTSENKLVRKVSELEKDKEEYNKMRMKDLNTQIILQDRVKELEGDLHAIAADYQLLENDHMRRKELVEQLSTTVELIEEENRKLHKLESAMNTELQCLRQEVNSGKEERQSLGSQHENQRREIKHWVEENEKNQSSLRHSQETVSELKVKVTSLTHKLENIEAKAKQLNKENEQYHVKERELLDLTTDLRSKVAILVSDKERLYQEKSDCKIELEKVSLHNKQMQEELLTHQLQQKRHKHDMELKEEYVKQTTENNRLLQEELSASQKVGEKLSLELTKTKEQLDRLEEQAVQTHGKSQQQEETIHSLRKECSELKNQLDMSRREQSQTIADFNQERKSQGRVIENIQIQLSEKLKENEDLSETVASITKKLQSLESTNNVQTEQMKAESEQWGERFDNLQASMQRKEDEVNMMSHKIQDYEAQLTKMLCEQETLQLDYDTYKSVQEENKRLTLSNRRLTEDKSETERVVQLLQTQRDIYARTVQEYTSKAEIVDKCTEENEHLENQLEHLRNSIKSLEDELENLRSSNHKLDRELNSSKQAHKISMTENSELKIVTDQLQQENMLLKARIEEKAKLKLEVQDLRRRLENNTEIAAAKDHLSDENGRLVTEMSELKGTKSFLSEKCSTLEAELACLREEKASLQRDVISLEQHAHETQKKCVALREDHERAKVQLAQSEERGSQYKRQIESYENELDSVNRQLKKTTDNLVGKEGDYTRVENELSQAKHMISHLQAQISALQTRATVGDLAKSENEVLAARCEKLKGDLDAAQDHMGEINLSSRSLTGDLDIARKEHVHLQQEVSSVKVKMGQLQESNEKQVSMLTGKLDESDSSNRELQHKLEKSLRELEDLKQESLKLTHQNQQKSEMIGKLESMVSGLKTDLRDSIDVQNRQDNLISTLKEEGSVLRLCQTELKDAKRKIRELHNQNDETEGTVSTLKREAQSKDALQKQLEEITSDLANFKSELQQTYATVHQRDLEIERLQSKLSNVSQDAEMNEEKVAELKIRLDQTEKAKDISSKTFQEKIHSLEAEKHTYKTRVLTLERQTAELDGRLNSASTKLNLSQDEKLLNQESNLSLQTARDSLQSECANLKIQLNKLQTEQAHTSSEKRRSQVELKESKMEFFKLEKEKDALERSNTRLDNSLAECNNLLKTVTKEYEICQTKLSERERDMERLRRDTNFSQEEHKEVKKVHEAETGRYKSEIKNFQHQISELKAQIRELEWRLASKGGDCENGNHQLMRQSDYNGIITDSGSEMSQSTDDFPSATKADSSDGAMTRDQTMKIFKQLKKAKQRSKKCLVPPPRVTEPLDEIKSRKDSFEPPEEVESEEDDSAAEHLKEKIMTKSDTEPTSCKVEWRGDPREATKKYISSWDLSVISDVDETETAADIAKSLPNLSTNNLTSVAGPSVSGSTESLGSLVNFDLTGTKDSPRLSSSVNSLNKEDQENQNTEHHDADASGTFLTQLSDDDSSEVVTEDSSPRSISSENSFKTSRIPKPTQSSPEVSPRSAKSTPDNSSRIPKPSNRSPIVVKKSTPAGESTTKLPKLTLFKKAT